MDLLFKHLAVRLWATAFVGGLLILVLLPPVAGLVGPGWMVVPGLLLFVVVYWATGIMFAAVGRRRVARLLDEASVWERAAMDREVRKALARAAATVDSFLFSPVSRKDADRRLLARTARFQMARTDSRTDSDAVVCLYLEGHPEDREAAIRWLERVMADGADDRRTHDLAAKIGAAHADDATIVRMLSRFYLAARRCDFAALETYERLVASPPAMAGEPMGALAELFLSHSRVDRLALSVYLMAHADKNPHPHLLSGIAACTRNIVPGPTTRPLLNRAEKVLAGLDSSHRHGLADSFFPDEGQEDPEASPKRMRLRWPAVGPWVREIRSAWKTTMARWAAGWARTLRGIGNGVRSETGRSVFKWTAMGATLIGVGWLVLSTISHLTPSSQMVAATPEPVVIPVTDPFTIQVAAYRNAGDARRHVEELKTHGLDAYWNQATGSRNVWYQVRVAHYPTKAAARAAGDDLKRKRLIGDYYVANYQPPTP